jgi:predicted phage-related endonuclease
MLQVVECEQGTSEWHAARTGVITASSFADVLAKGKGNEPSKTRRSYMLKLAAERIRGEAGDSFSSAYTERGHEFEDVARELYTAHTGNEVLPCGFMLDVYGYSPDGLVGEDGGIEIKTKSGHLQIEVLLSGEVPTEHLPQIQGGLMVSDRKWIDFISYCPGLPIFIKRVERDESYIANLRIELDKFEADLKEVVEQILSKF